MKAKLLGKQNLCSNVNEYVFFAPHVAKNCNAGQFVILIVEEDGERVPFTICDFDREAGTVSLLVQEVGYSTSRLATLEVGDSVVNFVGPLGNPTDLSACNRVLLVAGGIGVAVVYPQAKALKLQGKGVDVIFGARNADLLIYKDQLGATCDNLYVMTDDGSCGEKGFVTDKLKKLLTANDYDCVFAVGPLVMMKAVCSATADYGVKTIVSMNSLMLDGTGMCGCCRVTVGGEVKYACIDGPEFDGHKIDFDEAILRSKTYSSHENDMRNEAHKCNLRG